MRWTERQSERLPVAIGAALTLTIVGLFVLFQRSAGPLWRDEVNSVNLAHLPSLYEVYAHSHLDSFPTAWVILLYSWVAAGLGESDASLRVLGLLVGLATLGTWWWTGRRLGLRAPLLTLLLLGMNPTWVTYGTQVRGYGLGVLGLSWALGAMYSFVQRPSLGSALLAQAAAIAHAARSSGSSGPSAFQNTSAYQVSGNEPCSIDARPAAYATEKKFTAIDTAATAPIATTQAASRIARRCSATAAAPAQIAAIRKQLPKYDCTARIAAACASSAVRGDGRCTKENIAPSAHDRPRTPSP